MPKKKQRTLEVVLMENVESLGQKGEIKIVKPGYFFNFLLPRKLAIIASEKIKQKIAEEEDRKKIQKNKFQKELSSFRDSLPNILEIKTRINPKGVLYKKIDDKYILRKLKGEKYIKKIDLKEPFKKMGVYPVKLIFKDNIEKNIKVKIEKEDAKE